MSTGSYQQFDRPYRRGLVLGLSLAELFLILLFLLLLTFIGIATSYEEKTVVLANTIKSLEAEKSILTDGLEKIRQTNQVPITEAELQNLARSVGENKQLRDKNDKLTDLLVEKNKQLEELMPIQEEKEKLDDKSAKLQKELAERRHEVIQLRKQVEATEGNLSDAQAKAKEADSRAQANARLLDSIKKKPGDIPACWFVEVNSKDGMRQRHLKIYNVKINDESFVVRGHPFPYPKDANLGKPDSLPRIEEKFFNVELSSAEFTRAFSVIRAAGDNRIVQDYACKFMVDVYDATSSENKAGYKKQLRTVEDLFYKFEESSPWLAGRQKINP